MGKKKVVFLEKEYDISDQLPILVPILQSFDIYKDDLMSKLIAQMDKNTYSDGTDEKFAYWSQPISSIAKEIIRSAAKVGVYDLTEYDIVEENPGYKKLRQVCTETMRQMLLSETEAMLDWMEGYDNAYASAASNITGSGVGILTNSLSGALLYSAMEGNVLRKQAKEADKQFNAALNSLNARKDSKKRQDETRIKTNVYYPGCKESIELIVSYMLDTYLKKLDDNNVINVSEVAHYDIKAASEIMKNLEVIPQKAEVLGKAFEKCPYNSNIYATAIDLSLFDDASVETVKYLKIGKDFKAYLEYKIGDVTSATDIRSFISKSYYIHLVALMDDVDDMEYKKNRTKKIYESVVTDYNNLSSLLVNQHLCDSFASEINDENDIEGFIRNKVYGIISDGDFDQLRDKCGYYTLLNDIAPTGYKGVKSKESIDSYYIKTISDLCRPSVNERIKQQTEERIKKQEEERAESERIAIKEKERKKRNKIIAVIAGLIATITAVVLVTIFVVIPNVKYNEAKELMDSQSYLEAIAKFKKLDSNKYQSEIQECEKLYVNDLIENAKYDVAKEYLVSVVGKDNNSDEVKECDYLIATELFNEGKYNEAIELFQELKGFKDSEGKINASKYELACELKNSGDLLTAQEAFSDLGNYKDSKDLSDELQKQINYDTAISEIDSGAYADAVERFRELGDYKDAKKYVNEYKEKGAEELFNSKKYSKCVEFCRNNDLNNDIYIDSLYNYGVGLYNTNQGDQALEYLKACVDKYPDVQSMIKEVEDKNNYELAVSKMGTGDIDEAYELLSNVSSDYKDTVSLRNKCAKYVGMTGTWKCLGWEQDDGSLSTGDYYNYNLIIRVSFYGDLDESVWVKEDGNGHYSSYMMGGKSTYGQDINMKVSGKVISWQDGEGDSYTSYSFDTSNGILTWYLHGQTGRYHFEKIE